jgi:translocation and assembly module TamB
VLATELGFDISERFNVSLLAAPNVDNAPPQANLTFKASELFSVQGSLDTEGAWQTQLQVFFRF